MQKNLEIFMKKTLLSLAMNQKLDHHNYERIECPNIDLLLETFNYSIDAYVENKISLLMSAIDTTIQDYEKNENEEYDEKDIYQFKEDIFYAFIDISQFLEIKNLHADRVDDLKSEYLEVLKKNGCKILQ